MKKKQELSDEETLLLKKTTDFYISLDKLVRGINLYQGKGVLVERLLQDSFDRIGEITKRAESTVKISPIGPIVFGKPLDEDGKIPKYIFQMYRDGIRELSFQKGITAEELKEFANICSSDFGAIEDDMVTLLWKKDFSAIRYYAVDSLGVEVEEDVPDDLLSSSDSNVKSMQEGEEMQFSSSDMRLLKTKDNLNWVRICSAPAKAPVELQPALEQFEKYWTSKDPYSSFLAISLKAARTGELDFTLIEQMFASFLSAGEGNAVLKLLQAMVSISKQGVSSVVSLLQQICSEENLSLIVPFFTANLEEYVSVFQDIVELDGFDASSFVVLLEELEVGEAREAVQNIISASSIDMTPLYLSSLQDENETIVLEAINALGKIGSEIAVEALYLQLGNSLSTIRSAILEALNEVYSSKHRKQLGKTLKDPEKQNRLLSLRILEQASERDVGTMILSVMQESSFLRRDEEEKVLFFKSLSRFPSPTVFGYLNRLLQEKNITRNKGIIQKQLLAVEVYQEMKTPDALDMLGKASKNWFLPNEVKQKIKEILQ